MNVRNSTQGLGKLACVGCRRSNLRMAWLPRASRMRKSVAYGIRPPTVCSSSDPIYGRENKEIYGETNNVLEGGVPRRVSNSTRLSAILDKVRARITISWSFQQVTVTLLSLLCGFISASGVPHPESPRDMLVGLILLAACEVIGWLKYGQFGQSGPIGYLRKRTFFFQVLNTYKLGVSYGLFTDAFKVGS